MKYLSKKYFFIEILILLFPASLVIGPLVAELIMLFVSLFFLFLLFKEKNFEIFKNKFFYYYLFFFIYIALNSLFSSHRDLIFLDNIFYFRFLIFIFAVLFFLNKNQKLVKIFFYVLLITIGTVVFDGFIQYFSGQNLIGYETTRSDRLSGFFDDRMVLGSFLSRYFFLLLGLFFLLKDQLKKNLIFLSYIIIVSTYLLIFLCGERSAFYTSSLGIVLIFLTLNSSFYKKLLVFISISFIVLALGIVNNTMYDRYVKQTFSQIKIFNFGFLPDKGFLDQDVDDPEVDENNFFDRFAYYSAIFQTAYKGFLNNKIFGQGPKSFRYFCSEKNFETFTKDKRLVENNLIRFDMHKKFHKSTVTKIHVSINDEIKKGDLLLSYLWRNKSYDYHSTKEGIITWLHFAEQQSISKDSKLFTIQLLDPNISNTEVIFPNGCNTHPHQFYLQLMSETGIIGTLFILLNFFYLSFILLKHFLKQLLYKITDLNNVQLCLVINFITILFPIATTGNFFNNWLNMTFILQISFFLFFFQKNNKKK